MPYEVHVDSRTVFPALTTASGSTLEADNGDVVDLHPDVPEDVVKAFLDAGQLVRTTKSAPAVKPAAIAPADPVVVAAVKAAVEQEETA